MLLIRKEDLDLLVDHLRTELPHEGCGILGGRGDRALKVYRMSNTEQSPVRYCMDSGELAEAILDMHQNCLDIVGIYHSHLHDSAYPSSRDLQLAYYPDALYVIVSLADPPRPQIRGFRIGDGQVHEEDIVQEERDVLFKRGELPVLSEPEQGRSGLAMRRQEQEETG